MLMQIANLFTRRKYDPEEFRALLWKKPDSIEVYINETEGGYFAKLISFKDDNVVTQATNGMELIEMVNSAMYDYLDIPEVYRDEMGYFLPPENVRQEMKAQIPSKYLGRSFQLQKA